MKKIITLFVIVISFTSCSEKKIYFDSNWKETTKENASYYRDKPKKKNGIWLIKDYFISGEKQFIGHTKDSLATIFEGDVIWYFRTGKVLNKVRYKDGKQIGLYSVVEGAKGSEKEGWNESDLFFIDYSNALPAKNAKGSNSSVYEHYYANTSIIASQHTSNVGFDDKFSFTLYFDQKGDTIGRLDYNKTSDKWKGKEVLFYEEKTGKNNFIPVKQINTYSKGVVVNIEYFNMDNKQISNGSIHNGEPFTGTFFKEACRYHKIQKFENSNLLNEITYNKNDEKIGELYYENNIPQTGNFYDCMSSRTYKNGKLNGPSIQYLSSESESKEFEFMFKNGLKHGDYTIYQDESHLLEKGSYKNGMQIGDVVYYHQGARAQRDDNYYYLKANVKVNKKNPFISELSQFNLDNELLKTFKFEKNNSDKFTYLNNGFHSISFRDLNSDGFDDLEIAFFHHRHDITANTYYLFNSETNKYKHLPELDNAEDVKINTVEKAIIVSYKEKFEHQSAIVTYHFSTDKLMKKLVVEEIYHGKKDTTLFTQIFPKQLSKYPLLADDLPPIKFIQSNEEQHVNKTYQNILLNKEPLSITFPGLLDRKFKAKISASYNKDIFKKATINQMEEEISFFSIAHTFAVNPSDPVFIIDDDGHNIFYYENTSDHTLDYLKNINKNVVLFQLTIDKINDDFKEKTIAEINKPIYMIIYIDKNENLKIDKNEIHYLTITF